MYNNCSYLNTLSLWPPSAAIGAFLVTFCASLSNLIGASRVLEAVAKDVLFGPFLNFVTKGTIKDNPVAAVIVTWLLVQLFLLLGSLNTIAQLSSVLFLLSYGSVNLSCLGLDLASAPNFRPTFSYFSWHTSLAGLVGTTAMMLLISPIFSAVSILLCLSLVLALNLLSPLRGNTNWGSISQALLFHQVRKYLLLMDPRKAHVKFWRPQILLLVQNPRTACSLIDFVNSLKKGGLYVIGNVQIQNDEEPTTVAGDPCLAHYPYWLSLVDHLQVKAFVELTMAPNVREGVQHLVRISGIGAMKPNTILMGFKDGAYHANEFASSTFSTMLFEGIFPSVEPVPMDTNHTVAKTEYVAVIKDCLKLEKNVGLCKNFQSLNRSYLKKGSSKNSEHRKFFLDVWLVDFFQPGETDITDTTSLFILQLSYIVNLVPRWKKLSIRAFVMTQHEDESQPKEKLKRMLELLRIRAETHVLQLQMKSTATLTSPYFKSISELVKRRSTETAVIFLYMPCLPDHPSQYPAYLDALTDLTNQWPPTLDCQRSFTSYVNDTVAHKISH